MYSEDQGALKKMIRLENISKDLGEFFLRDITLDINETKASILSSWALRVRERQFCWRR